MTKGTSPHAHQGLFSSSPALSHGDKSIPFLLYRKLSKLLAQAIRIIQCTVFLPRPGSWGHLCFWLESHLDVPTREEHMVQREWDINV